MSCLTAVISPAFLYDISSSVENKNVELNTAVTQVSSGIDFTTHELSDIVLRFNVVNPTIQFEASCTEPTITINVSLICEVSPGNLEYLEVIEGLVILIDGQYVKVLKNGVSIR